MSKEFSKATTCTECARPRAQQVLAADVAGNPSGQTQNKEQTKPKRNVNQPVPLTRSMVACVAGDPAKNGSYDRSVTLKAQGEVQDVAQSQEKC